MVGVQSIFVAQPVGMKNIFGIGYIHIRTEGAKTVGLNSFAKIPLYIENGAARFLEIGGTRNEMIHGNLGSYFFDKTLDEVYEAHQRAEKFLDYLKNELS